MKTALESATTQYRTLQKRLLAKLKDTAAADAEDFGDVMESTYQEVRVRPTRLPCRCLAAALPPAGRTALSAHALLTSCLDYHTDRRGLGSQAGPDGGCQRPRRVCGYAAALPVVGGKQRCLATAFHPVVARCRTGDLVHPLLQSSPQAQRGANGAAPGGIAAHGGGRGPGLGRDDHCGAPSPVLAMVQRITRQHL